MILRNVLIEPSRIKKKGGVRLAPGELTYVRIQDIRVSRHPLVTGTVKFLEVLSYKEESYRERIACFKKVIGYLLGGFPLGFVRYY
jgi:hypothetical protein